MSLKLVIGNKNYSSWSLRAWLFLTESGLSFEEIRLPLFTDAWQQISQYTPAKRVPVLLDGDIRVWDSSAIWEYVRSQYPSAIGWPTDPQAHATARSIAAEMHSGFFGIREQLPQNIRARIPVIRSTLTATTQQEIDRVEHMWAQAYDTYGGPWLFGIFPLPMWPMPPLPCGSSPIRFSYHQGLNPLSRPYRSCRPSRHGRQPQPMKLTS
ncbi:MAG: glutathione S-transferase [Cyanobacteria bacterium P01_A01_bin.137]